MGSNLKQLRLFLAGFTFRVSMGLGTLMMVQSFSSFLFVGFIDFLEIVRFL